MSEQCIDLTEGCGSGDGTIDLTDVAGGAGRRHDDVELHSASAASHAAAFGVSVAVGPHVQAVHGRVGQLLLSLSD